MNTRTRWHQFLREPAPHVIETRPLWLGRSSEHYLAVTLLAIMAVGAMVFGGAILWAVV